MKAIGYARANSPDTLKDCEKSLADFGCDEIFTECISGLSTDHPKLDIALNMLESGDIFVSPRAERITRSIETFINIQSRIEHCGAKLQFIEDNSLTTPTCSKISSHIRLNIKPNLDE